MKCCVSRPWNHHRRKRKEKVVSTIISGILFACFCTVQCIPTVYGFLVTSLTVEARNEKENRLFAPLLINFASKTFCSRLQHTHFSRQIFKRTPLLESELSFLTGTFLNNYDVINRKLSPLLTYSIVEKQADRMPDITVETI